MTLAGRSRFAVGVGERASWRSPAHSVSHSHTLCACAASIVGTCIMPCRTQWGWRCPKPWAQMHLWALYTHASVKRATQTGICRHIAHYPKQICSGRDGECMILAACRPFSTCALAMSLCHAARQQSSNLTTWLPFGVSTKSLRRVSASSVGKSTARLQREVMVFFAC